MISSANILTRTYSPDNVEQLQRQGFSPVMARLLAGRDIPSAEQLGGELSDLIPPDQLLGIQQMARLLADAIQQQQKILIIGDYDCDGATATALGLKALRRMGAVVDFLVPNRFEYGYGLSPEIVQLAKQSDPHWIITVDNGIASVAGVETANALGIQVLITDHHLPGQHTPAAAAIVNPNQRGCPFASKHLAGVGVIFYVMLALRAELRQRAVLDAESQPRLDDLLDLVALGTVADLVKLDRNNRILVQHGLKRIRAGQACAGIRALFQIAGRDMSHATAQDLGFSIGPRINAAGRLDDIALGIECLTAEHLSYALPLAQQLNQINLQRREIEQEIKFSAQSLLDETPIDQRYTVCLLDESWHHGVIGVVASRLKDSLHRPVIVFAPDEQDLLRGSGRSIANLHLRDALDAVSKLDPNVMVKFGGHAMAAGLSIYPAQYQRFCDLFEQVVAQLLTPADLQKQLAIDGSLDASDLQWPLAEQIEQQIWGQGFPAPLFCDTFAVVSQRVLSDKHLKLQLRRCESDLAGDTVAANGVVEGSVIEAIFFQQQDLLPERVRLVYQLQTNRFRQAQNVQLNILHVLETALE